MKFQISIPLAAAALLAGGLALAAVRDDGKGYASAAQKTQKEGPTDVEIVAQQKPSYPLKTCVVSGEKLGSMGPPVDHVVEGRLVRLCCRMCIEPLARDTKAAFEKIDAAVIRVQKPMWPAALSRCPVSGEPYGGEMGEPVDHVYGTRYVKLCCKGCKKALANEPQKYLAIIDAALIEDQRKRYPLTTCPVSGEALGDDAVDHLYGVTLVRFCCTKCIAAFERNPDTYLDKLETARKKDAPAKD